MGILDIFKKKAEVKTAKRQTRSTAPNSKDNNRIATRKGEIGEHKIDIQLSQFPKEYKYLSDIMVENPKSATGYSQIDHIVITSYGIFVIETKNYQGTIYGGRERKTWLVNGKFKMMSPVLQNYGHIEALKPYIDNKFHRYFVSVISFTKRCTLKIGMDLREISSDEIVIYDLYLTETIKRKLSIAKMTYKEPLFTEKDIAKIHSTLKKINITDKKIRDVHTNKANKSKELNRLPQNAVFVIKLFQKKLIAIASQTRNSTVKYIAMNTKKPTRNRPAIRITTPNLRKLCGMEVCDVGKKSGRKQGNSQSDEQAVRKDLSKEFDHEFANEPLTPREKYNNKKTKKRH
ncbi:small acid-soluble spore protein O [Virgibacillus kekensis]|uniref:Small acid-soluble spore protein O n=1 Tax=Virgibacillus kekensis TaxID=202261 RepID=A0ABV9DLW8_9BACI